MRPPVLIEKNGKEEEIARQLKSYGFVEVDVCDPDIEAIIDATFEKEYGYCVAGTFLNSKERLEEFMEAISDINEAYGDLYRLKVLPVLPKECTQNTECIEKIISDDDFLPPVIDGMYHSCEVAASIVKDRIQFEKGESIKKGVNATAPVHYGNGVVYYPKGGYINYKAMRIPVSEKKGKLFLRLLENMGSTVSKDSLVEELELPSDVSLRVLISKLKETIGEDFTIYNLRSIGYGMEPINGLSHSKKEIAKEETEQ